MTQPYTLYGYWRSSCSWRVRIALHHKGIPFENLSVHLVKDGGQQHAAEYVQKNPMHQVPTFYDREKDIYLTQSMAIIDYLEHLHPTPSLLPKDPVEAIRVRSMAEIINSGIQPLQNLGTLKQLEARFGADPAQKAEWAAHFIAKGFQALEVILQETAGDFCFGNEITLVDVCLIPQIYGAHRFKVDMSAYPTLNRVVEACNQLEAFKLADASAQPDAQ